MIITVARGILSPFSQKPIALRLKPVAFASCACVSSFSNRNSFNLLLNFSIIKFYHKCGKKLDMPQNESYNKATLVAKKMDYKIVAERMRKLRKEKGIYFRHIEETTGLRFERVSRLLTGKSAPRLSEFALMCLALGVSADELLKADDEWQIIER